MLEQISCLGEFWFMRYGPKCSWPIRLPEFSINHRTLKLAVSHEEINGVNWFLVCPFNSFLMNCLLGLTDFWHNVDNQNIEKLTLLFFPRKFIFVQIWANRAQNSPKIWFSGFFEKFCYVSFSWK